MQPRHGGPDCPLLGPIQEPLPFPQTPVHKAQGWRDLQGSQDGPHRTRLKRLLQGCGMQLPRRKGRVLLTPRSWAVQGSHLSGWGPTPSAPRPTALTIALLYLWNLNSLQGNREAGEGEGNADSGRQGGLSRAILCSRTEPRAPGEGPPRTERGDTHGPLHPPFQRPSPNPPSLRNLCVSTCRDPALAPSP